MRLLRTMLLLALLTIFLVGLPAQALTISIDCRLSTHLPINAGRCPACCQEPAWSEHHQRDR
jgi:hypothetical protein